MNNYRGQRRIERHSKCLNGLDCKGPGCRVATGKTAREQNFARPRHNAHNAEAAVKSTSSKPKGSR